MPAQKRPLLETLDGHGDEETSPQQNFRRRQRHRYPRRLPVDVQPLEDDVDNDDEDSEGIDPADLPEVIHVDLDAVRKDVQCPICLGIIKNTRTVMACMHRFCAECIEKSMRLGDNKECPICRVHCSSRRSLRDDLIFDSLISLLFPDIEKYEQEECSLLEEEKTRNNQIQDSFAQIYKRQSDALNKRVRTGKDAAEEASIPALPQYNRRASTRRGGPNTNPRDQTWENQDENEDEDDNKQDEENVFRSNNEHGTENKKRKSRRGRRGRRRFLAVANLDSGESDIEIRGIERLSWGGGGNRTHGRHSGACGSNGTGNTRLNRLVNHLQSLQVNDKRLEVNLMLISLDNQRTTSSQKLHLCCDPRFSVKNLCEYIANETFLEAKEVEVMLAKTSTSTNTEQSTCGPSASMDDDMSYLGQVVGQARVGLITLKGQETLAELQANGSSVNGDLILAYRRKVAPE